MNNFKITCRCGRFVTKNDDLYKLSLYKVKNPTLKRTDRGERIVEELFYYYVCPECGREVVLIKRKALNAVGAKKVLIPEKLIGENAAAYMEMTAENRINKTSELRYNATGKYTKGIPLSYFKTISATEQRPRYINEVCYSGKKVENEIRIYN